MAHDFDPVEPGDLITAELFNAVTSHLEDLERRVTELEGSGTGVTLKPLPGPIRIGSEVTVAGTNFEIPARLNQVTLGSIPITSFNPGTDDSHLVFNVPQISGVPREVPFTVSNRNGVATITVTVQPAAVQPPIGELRITQQPLDQGDIVVGDTYTFPFVVDSQTDRPETYLLDVLYSSAVGVGAATWRASTRLTNLSGEQVGSATVAPGSPVLINVVVTVPAGATSVDMSLRARSLNSPSDPLLNVTASPLTIVVGAAPEVSDPRTTFAQLMVIPSENLVSDPELGSVVETLVGQQSLIRISAEFTVEGSYTYSTRVVPENTALWVATVVSPASAGSTETAGGAELIVVELSAIAADSTASRTLEIHAVRSGDTSESFDSWFSIRIRNRP